MTPSNRAVSKGLRLTFTKIDKNKIKVSSSCGGSYPCKAGCSIHPPSGEKSECCGDGIKVETYYRCLKCNKVCTTKTSPRASQDYLRESTKLSDSSQEWKKDRERPIVIYGKITIGKDEIMSHGGGKHPGKEKSMKDHAGGGSGGPGFIYSILQCKTEEEAESVLEAIVSTAIKKERNRIAKDLFVEAGINHTKIGEWVITNVFLGRYFKDTLKRIEGEK